MYRQQTKQIIEDLAKKIVFIIGPRQVGKTWLAKEIGKQYPETVYLNYDRLEDRQIIKKEQWLEEDTELLILDEIHKMKNWKNYLKGIFDTKSTNLKILVTGSARLDAFRQVGDSLAGRFFAHRLLPFSLAEVSTDNKLAKIDRFLKRGGFPEPFLESSGINADRWRQQYIDGLIRTDVLDFEKIHDFRAIQLVLELLKRKVGSPISYASMAEDIGISPKTVKQYISILESLFIIFSVTPFSQKIARSISKRPKIYFYDNGLVVGDEGIKLENFVAVSLLKNILWRNDSLGKNEKLQYLRTKTGQEVDFAIISSDNNIKEIIEVKLSDDQLSKNLKYFSDKYKLSARQIVKNLKRERAVSDRIKIVRAEDYLMKLSL